MLLLKILTIYSLNWNQCIITDISNGFDVISIFIRYIISIYKYVQYYKYNTKNRVKSHQKLMVMVDFSMKSYPLSMKHKTKEQSVSVFSLKIYQILTNFR